MERKQFICNYQTKNVFIIDTIEKNISKMKFNDIEYLIEASEKYILYETTDEQAVCYDMDSREIVCKKRVPGHDVNGLLDNQVVFENIDKMCKYVVYDIYNKTEKAYDLMYLVAEYIGNGPEIWIADADYFDNMFYVLVYAKWNEDKIESYVFTYDILTNTLKNNVLFEEGCLQPAELWFSEEENVFYVMFFSNRGTYTICKTTKNFEIENQIEIHISGIVGDDICCDYAEARDKLFVGLGTEDNRQCLIIIDKNTLDNKIIYISEDNIYGLALYYLDKNLLYNVSQYSERYGDREFFYLLDEKGKVIGESRYIEELLCSYSVSEDKEDRIDKNKILEAGKRAEDDVEYQLDFLPKAFVKVNKGKEGIVIYNEDFIDKKQEIDHIVIGEQGVFLIETKNIGGSLYIDESEIWSREKRGVKEVIENPDGQVQRHHNLVQSILNIDEIIDVICIANKKTDIEGSENSRIPVVRCDRILGFIQNYRNNTGRVFSQQERNKIKEQLEEYRV